MVCIRHMLETHLAGPGVQISWEVGQMRLCSAIGGCRGACDWCCWCDCWWQCSILGVWIGKACCAKMRLVAVSQCSNACGLCAGCLCICKLIVASSQSYLHGFPVNALFLPCAKNPVQATAQIGFVSWPSPRQEPGTVGCTAAKQLTSICFVALMVALCVTSLAVALSWFFSRICGL